MSRPLPEHIALPRGLELSCFEQGDPRGIPLLLLHGYTDSWRSYRPLLAELPYSIRVIAVTQRGHGDSSKPASAYGISDFAADVPVILDRLGIERAVLLGHSMGSLVAQRFAIDHPDRTLGLVLIGAFRAVAGNAGAEALWQAGVAAATDPLDPAFVRAFQASTLADAVPPAFFETVVAESLKVPARVWRAALRAMLDEDFSGELCRIAAPTLLLWGDQDGFSGREEQEALRAAIKGAALLVDPGAGHSPHWEHPTRSAAAIAAFVGQLAAATG